jgi:hypothetical protein
VVRFRCLRRQVTPYLRLSSSTLRDAVDRALAYLLTCQLPSGAINDVIANPLAALATARPTRRMAFRLRGGADIWHTTQAILAFSAAGRSNPAAEHFVRSRISRRGELSYWSGHPSLCIETCSAAWHALPSQRNRLTATLVRHALPGGRWPNFILPGRGGYDSYLAGPSVTAWAIGALGARHPLTTPGLAHLLETLTSDGLWRAHPAFYATPYYPAHLAVAYVGEKRSAVVRATLRQQSPTGGWGFEDFADRPSPLPTAFAIRTLVAAGVRTPQCKRSLRRAVRWLLNSQSASGAFRLAPAPAELFYAGDVFATCVAISALIAVFGNQSV